MTLEEQLERQIEKNKRSIEQARRAGERIDRTIRDSNRRTERARAILRRAGYLSDAD